MKIAKIIFVILLFTLTCTIKIFSQQGSTFAAAGEKGIYVALGISLPSKTHPVDNAVGYRIERRGRNESTWTKLADVSSPESLDEFKSRLEKFNNIIPVPLPLDQVPVNDLWNKISAYGNADSLKFWSGVLCVRLAAGMMYLDSTVSSGGVYTYRVSKIDASGNSFEPLISNVEKFPANVSLSKPHIEFKTAGEKTILLRWNGGTGKSPAYFRAYRQDNLKGDFTLINPLKLITAKQDSTFLIVQDTLISPLQLYKYFVVTLDYFGNTDAVSDTVLVGSYDFRNVPFPDQLHSESSSSLNAIRISWRLEDPRLVRNLSLYKSADFDTGFVKIEDLSPSDTFFVDQQVLPMKKYFYYLVMHGPLGEVSPPSAKVFGMLRSTIKPVPPNIFKSEGTNNGVRLEIFDSDKLLLGYRVYRSNGFNSTLQLISNLVPYHDSMTVYTDTSSLLQGDRIYLYAVRAENSSHVVSDFSDTVSVRPHKPTTPPTPMNLTAYYSGNHVQLYWDDLQPVDGALRGYYVYRRELNQSENETSEYRKLVDTLLNEHTNRFADTTAVEGNSYEYAIQAIDIFGGKSELSSSAKIFLSIPLPIAPGGLRAENNSNSILITWDETIQNRLAGYRIYRYVRGTNPIIVGQINNVKELSFTDSTVRKGNLYFYFITSVNNGGKESKPSEEVLIRF